MMNHNRNRVDKYFIEILTPVHVDTGRRLVKDVDFFSKKGNTWIVDPQFMAEALSMNPKALNDFTESEAPDIHKIAAENKIDLVKLFPKCYRGEANKNGIFEFMRNGAGDVLLPGSSVKGAIRTALLWSILNKKYPNDTVKMLQKSYRRKEKPDQAADGLINQVFNIGVGSERKDNDSNRNLMRALQVSDSHFNENDLILADIRVMNQMKDNTLKVKFQVYGEVLEQKSTSTIKLTFDEFLLQCTASEHHMNFSAFSTYFNDLPKYCNEFALRQIDKQIAFFQGKEKFLVDAYRGIKEKIENLPEDDFVLRLSWGAGWQGMTGELFDEETDLDDMRIHFAKKGKWIGKMLSPELPDCPNDSSHRVKIDNTNKDAIYCSDCRRSFPASGIDPIPVHPFPKTRKIIYENNHPSMPFGWVLFRKQGDGLLVERKKYYVNPPPYVEQVPRHQPNLSSFFKKATKPSTTHDQVNVNDKVRGFIVRANHPQYSVRFTDKNNDQELQFKFIRMPLQIDEKVELRILGVAPDGQTITKVEFVKKIQ